MAYLKDKINVYDDKGTHPERLLKMAVVDFDCRMENMECLNTMSALFNSIPKSYFRDPNTQPNPYLYRKKNLSIFLFFSCLFFQGYCLIIELLLTSTILKTPITSAIG